MKRIIALILVIFTAAAVVCGCNGGEAPVKETEKTTVTEAATAEVTTEEQTEEQTEAPTEEIIVAPDEDGAVSAWYVHSLQRLTRTNPNRPV